MSIKVYKIINEQTIVSILHAKRYDKLIGDISNIMRDINIMGNIDSITCIIIIVFDTN